MNKFKVILIDKYDHEKELKNTYDSKYAAKSAANKQLDRPDSGAVDYRIEVVS